MISSCNTNRELYFRITDNSNLPAPYAANLYRDSLTWIFENPHMAWFYLLYKDILHELSLALFRDFVTLWICMK